MPTICFTAFAHGFTGHRTMRKSNPARRSDRFIDSRPLEEFLATGAFEEPLISLQRHIESLEAGIPSKRCRLHAEDQI